MGKMQGFFWHENAKMKFRAIAIVHIFWHENAKMKFRAKGMARTTYGSFHAIRAWTSPCGT